MHRLRIAALIALVVGVACAGYAVARGDVRVGLFFIVPFIYGTGGWAALGFLLLIAAAVLGFFSVARVDSHPDDLVQDEAPGTATGRETRRRSGGVVLLGPIPIVWGSDRRILPWMIAAGAALLLLAWWLTTVRR